MLEWTRRGGESSTPGLGLGSGGRQQERPGQVAPQGRRPPLSAHNDGMANQAKLTLRVTSQRGSSGISFSTAGRYISLPTNGISADLVRQPVQPTSSAKAFWLSVLAIVTAQISALP